MEILAHYTKLLSTTPKNLNDKLWTRQLYLFHMLDDRISESKPGDLVRLNPRLFK